MSREPLTYDNIVHKLVETVPDLQTIYDSHLADNDELLSHVFFGDLTRYVIACFRMPSTTLDSAALHRNAATILNTLEQTMMASDSRLQELVSVSFLENLHQAGEVYEKIKENLGPNLRKELLTYE